MPENFSISIIMPTLNEAASLPHALGSLSDENVTVEILVVDGGSSDQTQNLAKEAGARLLISPLRQRAAQMNMGAHAARGEILFFLHADTRLPANALEKINACMAKPETVGGAFCRRFDHISLFLKFTCLLADLRLRWFGWSFGDQGIFVRKSIFEEMGGFPEIDLLEDMSFSRRLAQRGKTAILNPPILTSGRRFGRNPIRKTFQDILLTWKYLK